MLMRHLTLIKDCLGEFQDRYHFILIDSHPDLHDLEKAVIFASDYCVSPVKLDNQSAVGVPSTVEAIHNVDEDALAVGSFLGVAEGYVSTRFLGALPMMCREWGDSLKYSEQVIYNRLRLSTGIFEAYTTEGDGIRQASAAGTTVYDISGPNAEKQKQQFVEIIDEFLSKVI